MRHNRRMPRLSCVVASLVLLSAGCGRVDVPAEQAGEPGTGMEFSGVRACADCDAILSWLRLDANGRSQRYRLVERYRTAVGERRFEEAGNWRAEGDLLRLSRTGGGERVYVRLADGRLQGRTMEGRMDRRLEDDLLAPLTFDHSR